MGTKVRRWIGRRMKVGLRVVRSAERMKGFM